MIGQRQSYFCNSEFDTLHGFRETSCFLQGTPHRLTISVPTMMPRRVLAAAARECTGTKERCLAELLLSPVPALREEAAHISMFVGRGIVNTGGLTVGV